MRVNGLRLAAVDAVPLVELWSPVGLEPDGPGQIIDGPGGWQQQTRVAVRVTGFHRRVLT